MQVSCAAILIQSLKYSDNSLILKILREDGIIHSCIAKGVHRKNSPISAAFFQPLSYLDMEFIMKPNIESMHILKSASFADNPHILYKNPIKQSLLFFYAEVIQQILKQDIQQEYSGLFRYIYEKRKELENMNAVSVYLPLQFMLEIMQYSGIGIESSGYEEGYGFDLQESRFIPPDSYKLKELYLDPQSSLLLFQLLNDEMDQISSTRIQRNELLQKLIIYYRIHLQGGFQLKSPEILTVVLE